MYVRVANAPTGKQDNQQQTKAKGKARNAQEQAQPKGQIKEEKVTGLSAIYKRKEAAVNKEAMEG